MPNRRDCRNWNLNSQRTTIALALLYVFATTFSHSAHARTSSEASEEGFTEHEGIYPTILAGESPDSPAAREDDNVLSSEYGGVGSFRLFFPGFTGICSGTAISPMSVLTAAHCLDDDDDGEIDIDAEDVEFRLNHDGNGSTIVFASDLTIHPDYTGFNNPNVNDDLAVVTLSSPLPAGTPIYDLYTPTVTSGTVFTMVGYGKSGRPDVGFSVGASASKKRVGQNTADTFSNDDEGSGMSEIFRFDLDGPTGVGSIGGGTLGNEIETMIGGGDSGGPSFVDNNGNLEIAGINTFIQFNDEDNQGNPIPINYGSVGGGVLVNPYISWIEDQIVAAPGDLNDDGLVGQGDLNLVLTNWGLDIPSLSPDWINDLPDDGLVGQDDLNLVLLNWGLGAPLEVAVLAAIPEPTTVFLTLTGIVVFTGTTRRTRR